MKRCCAVALSIILVSVFVIGCGKEKEAITSNDSSKKRTEESIAEEHTEEKTVDLFHTKRPVTCNITVGSTVLETETNLQGEYTYYNNGSYSLKSTYITDNKAIGQDNVYYFSPSGVITWYELTQFDSNHPEGHIADRTFFIKGIPAQARNSDYYGILNIFRSHNYIGGLTDVSLDYDDNGDVLGDIVASPIIPGIIPQYHVKFIRDDNGRIIKSFDFYKDFNLESHKKADGTYDFSELGELYNYTYTKYEYDETGKSFTVIAGTAYPNQYNAETRSIDGTYTDSPPVTAYYNEHGQPTKIVAAHPHNSNKEWCWYFEYDEYGYLTHVRHDDGPFIHIENNYSDAPEMEKEAKEQNLDNDFSEEKNMSEDEAFTFGKEKVMAKFPNVPIEGDFCFHDTMDCGSYYLFSVYTEVDDGEEVAHAHHLCELEVEKNGSEVRFADGNPTSENDFSDWWEPKVIYPN